MTLRTQRNALALLCLMAAPAAARADVLDIRTRDNVQVADPDIRKRFQDALGAGITLFGDARNDVYNLDPRSGAWKTMSMQDRVSIGTDLQTEFGKYQLSGPAWDDAGTYDTDKLSRIAEEYAAALLLLTSPSQFNTVFFLDGVPAGYSTTSFCIDTSDSKFAAHQFFFFNEGNGIMKTGIVDCWTNIGSHVTTLDPQGAHSLAHDLAQCGLFTAAHEL